MAKPAGPAWNEAIIQDEGRISVLASSHFKLVHRRDVGDEEVGSARLALYQDPADGRYWEEWLPHPEGHGDGPRELRVVSPGQARLWHGRKLDGRFPWLPDDSGLQSVVPTFDGGFVLRGGVQGQVVQRFSEEGREVWSAVAANPTSGWFYRLDLDGVDLVVASNNGYRLRLSAHDGSVFWAGFPAHAGLGF